eukprot:TRINITY_DN6376_c0_g3_i11.p2 TRINITY_DN6376_c0_g3~~TRINITY_DN6376_c0_g3_i11.p2  ORF type:complete len:187 (+),score=77.84 TRINITY_DN6376_c0_g3_i11:1339-1899(+)
MMRGSEIIREKKEFEELLVKNEKKRKAMSSNYINLTITEHKTTQHDTEILERIEELKQAAKKRQTIQWKPEPLLCKKFDVLDPYEHKPFHKEEREVRERSLKDFVKDAVMRGGRSETETFKGNDGNLFFKEVQASFIEEGKEEAAAEKQEEKVEDGVEDKAQGEEQLVVSMEARPEMSLFQSIFDD